MASNPSTKNIAQGDQSHGIVAANLVVAILATIAVALRLISRKIQRLPLQADDILIFLALPFGWAMCICTLIAVHYGLGKHMRALNPSLLAKEGQAFFASELIWATSIPIIKISILLLYIRIFGRLRYFRLLAYTLGIFSVCWGIMVVLVVAFQCRPVQLVWDKSIQGTCIDSPVFFIAGSAPNVFTDFVILALPWHAVWQLKLSTMQKISLVAIFSLGSLTCIIGLVRLINLIQNTDPDVTWSLGFVSIWSTAEPCLGIVSASLPTMGPLVRKLLPLARNLSPSRYYHNQHHHHHHHGPTTTTPAHNNSAFNSSGSTYNQLEDKTSFSTRTTIETNIGSGQKDGGSMDDIKTKHIPINAIGVETSTSWSDVTPKSPTKHV